jgi:preprotein translocase subunit SecF
MVVAALDRRFNPEVGNRLDLNRAGTEAISALLAREDRRAPEQEAETAGAEAAEAQASAEEGDAAAGETGETIDQVPALDVSTADVAQTIVDLRREDGLIESWDQVAALSDVTPSLLARLQERAALGSYAILGVENVGPQIGEELRRKGQLAVVLSLVGMMIYIWIRFELRFGVGAVVASLHDVLITLGLFALAGYEFNLTTIAAFLTLVGYSVNDTVVIFDRVRENLRRTRRQPTGEVMNLSLNQTLSRTVLTSGTTLVAMGCLYLLGGDVIRGFAFVMVIGVIVGTYSSIFVACPFALLWEQLFRRQAKTGQTKTRQAKTGRASSRL